MSRPYTRHSNRNRARAFPRVDSLEARVVLSGAPLNTPALVPVVPGYPSGEVCACRRNRPRRTSG
jgi:hypothetical protein